MHTRRLLKQLSVLCAGALLLACADMTPHPGAPAGPDAEQAYAQGRAHHIAGRYTEAIAVYQAVLAANPGHVATRNALAAAFARQGDFAHAIPIWQTLTAELAPDSGPGSAYLFANLGYAYLLGGDLQHAVVALEKACVLDPLDHGAWQHLGESLQQLGQDERADMMFRQASALREHNIQRDIAVTGGSAVAAIQAAVAAPGRPDPEWAATEVHTALDGTLELHRIPSQRALVLGRPERAPDPAPPAHARPDVVLLEIRNGNGVTGMARALSRQVGGDGVQVTRLSNEKGFKVLRTRIEHRASFRDAAERLAERFDDVQLIEVDTCKPSDLRLVIGQDFARGKVVLRTPLRNNDTLAVALTPPKAP